MFVKERNNNHGKITKVMKNECLKWKEGTWKAKKANDMQYREKELLKRRKPKKVKTNPWKLCQVGGAVESVLQCSL